MSNPVLAAPRLASDVKTAHVDFFNVNPEGARLFSVRAGIPIGDAFDQLALLLSAGKCAVDEVCATVSADAEPQSQWAASHLLEFSYALVLSIHQGVIDHDRKNANG